MIMFSFNEFSLLTDLQFPETIALSMRMEHTSLFHIGYDLDICHACIVNTSMIDKRCIPFIYLKTTVMIVIKKIIMYYFNCNYSRCFLSAN